MADGTLIKDLTQTTSINDDDDMIIEDSTPTTKRVAVSDLGLKIAPTTNKIWYATCTTSSGTTAKVATTEKDGFELTTGVMIAVRFTYNNTASNPTLNVNSTGAKGIATGGTSSGGSINAIAYHWAYSDIVLFCYNGSYWIMIGKMVATTTYYGVTKLTDSTSSTSTTTAATPNSVKTAYDAAVAAQETADELNSNKSNGLVVSYTEVTSLTISASTATEESVTITKSGYKALGVVGVRVVDASSGGQYSSMCSVYCNYLYDSDTVKVRFRNNNNSNSAVIQYRVYVLYVAD